MTPPPCRKQPAVPLTRSLHWMAVVAALALAGCSSVDSTAFRGKSLSLASMEGHPTSSATRAVLGTPGMVNAQVAPPENPLPALPSPMSSTLSPSVDEGADAVGQPTDPLSPDTPINLDDASAKRDLWTRVRQGFALKDLDGDLVREHERWYASRPDYVRRMTERSSRYLFHIIDEVQRRNMPGELALLPFIESAFNPRALSSAKASGMWQFIPSTGKHFDLKQNVFRDDRRDVLASTKAALDYLQKLHDMFGDWHLALAAYNWGEGNVQRAIRRNEKAGLPTDYASLSMPAETRHYVPKLQAVENIIARPESFGLELPPIENHPYFVAVPIRRDIDVALAARLAGLTEAEFRELNPSQSKPVVLAAGTPQILLPYENAERFVVNLQTHVGPLASWTAWTVPRTVRPSEAARLAGLPETRLRELNHIPPRVLIKAGSTLLIPRSDQRQADVPEAVADNATMLLAPDLPPMRKMMVRAGKRDTVASLARRYRVSPTQLAQWNRLSASSKLAPGQSLAVFRPAGKAAVRMAAAGRAPSRLALKGKASRSHEVSTKAVRMAKASKAKGGASASRARSRATSRVASADRASVH